MSGSSLVGIDVGATWVKAAPVSLDEGLPLREPVLMRSPRPATPLDVAQTVAHLVMELEPRGPVGVTLPCIVDAGRSRSASNIDPAWIDLDATALMSDALDGRPVTVLNDADAAGLAEARFGAAKDQTGTVLVLTFGTGIGSALLRGECLVPNTEFGHLRMPDGRYAERHVGPSNCRNPGFDWGAWCMRVNAFLDVVDLVVRPDVIVVGGGVSAVDAVPFWREHLTARAPIVPAILRNQAGIVGAAMAAAERVAEVASLEQSVLSESRS